MGNEMVGDGSVDGLAVRQRQHVTGPVERLQLRSGNGLSEQRADPARRQGRARSAQQQAQRAAAPLPRYYSGKSMPEAARCALVRSRS